MMEKTQFLTKQADESSAGPRGIQCGNGESSTQVLKKHNSLD